jgi:hypothetical protein
MRAKGRWVMRKSSSIEKRGTGMMGMKAKDEV